MLAKKKLEEMKNATIRGLGKYCHRVVEVIDFKVIEDGNENFSCVLEGYVGRLRKRKRYSFNLNPSKTKGNCSVMSDIQITEF